MKRVVLSLLLVCTFHTYLICQEYPTPEGPRPTRSLFFAETLRKLNRILDHSALDLEEVVQACRECEVSKINT